MKKIILSCLFLIFSAGIYAQAGLIGKWEVFTMSSEGKTFTKEQLKGFGKADDFLQLLQDGKVIQSDEGVIRNGSWIYDKAKKILSVTIEPTEEEKNAGQGTGTAKYTVDKIEKEYLSLSLGKIMKIKYKKSAE